MKIGNGTAGFRVAFTEGELSELSNGGEQTTFSLQFNPNSQDHFIVFAAHDLPHGERVALTSPGSNVSGKQFYLTAKSGRFKPFLSKIPVFGSEAGILRKTEDSNGPVWHVIRPKMDVPIMKRPERTKPKKAFAHEKEHKPVEMAGNGMEIIPKPELPKVPAGEQKLFNAVATMNNMEAAINILNKIKDEKGESMIMEITSAGRLKVLLEYGG